MQVTNGTTGSGGGAGVKFGLFGNTNNAIIASQQANGNMYFATAGSAFPQIKMTILPNGNVGIGSGPAFILGGITEKLDVDQGDIDVNTPQRSYMIGDQSVLWHKGSNENIFVGVGAGQTQGLNLASRNTYIGKNAGFSGTGVLTPGSENNENVIIGWNAGFNNLFQRATIIGVEAGFNSQAGWHTLVGYRAGFSYNGSNPSTNTFIGYESGFGVTTAVHNTFVGFNSGQNSTTGEENTFIGNVSGQNNSTGERNTFVGFVSGNGNGAFNDNVYIGNRSGSLSVGDQNTFVGNSSGFNGGGIKNVAMGFNAFSTSTVGVENVALGNEANLGGQNNNFNSFMGSQSAPVLVNSNLNTLIGYRAAQNQTLGVSNSYLGENTGIGVLTGTNNTFLGAKADVTTANSTTVTNATAVGANAKVTHADHMILGDNNVNVGIGLSGDAAGPGNKLEINTGVANTSGLKFRQLNSSSPTVANPGLGVLALDATGNAIYVLGGGGGSLGNACGTATPNPLPSDWEIPLNTNFNFHFTSDNAQTNKVNVGIPCATLANGKFNVTTAVRTSTVLNESYSIYSTNTNGISLNNVGVFGGANSLANNLGFEIGVWGVAIGGRSAYGVFGEGRASTGGLARGGLFHALSPANNTNIGTTGIANAGVITNRGVEGSATGGQFSFGGFFTGNGASQINIGVSGIAWSTTTPTVPSYPLGTNIGVFGQGNPNPASGSPGPDWAAWFDGDVWLNSPNGGTNFVFASDQLFKTNIDSISNARNIINQLKPKQFYFDTTNTYGMYFSSKKQYGLIAQDVATILPELVTTVNKPAMVDSSGNIVTPSVSFKNLNYGAFTAIVIKALQESNRRQDSLVNVITALSSSVSSCCSSSAVRVTTQAEQNQLNVNLSDEDIIVLNQNNPNPFAEQTTITYIVPEKYGYAQIIFRTIEGKIIKTVDITKKGGGQLNVFAGDLSSGMYSYSLIVDGKEMSTKKMVKSE